MCQHTDTHAVSLSRIHVDLHFLDDGCAVVQAWACFQAKKVHGLQRLATRSGCQHPKHAPSTAACVKRWVLWLQEIHCEPWKWQKLLCKRTVFTSEPNMSPSIVWCNGMVSNFFLPGLGFGSGFVGKKWHATQKCSSNNHAVCRYMKTFPQYSTKHGLVQYDGNDI